MTPNVDSSVAVDRDFAENAVIVLSRNVKTKIHVSIIRPVSILEKTSMNANAVAVLEGNIVNMTSMNAPVVWHAITGLLASTLLEVTNVNADQDLKGEGVVMI